MIGNDVVDLEQARRESNWRRKGFLEKVFSPAEQDFLSTSNDPDLAVWLLWSMKEAAYKAHQREYDLPRQLNWLAQECEVLKLGSNAASGVVNISGSTYYTSSEITLEYVHTSAEKLQNTGVKNVIFEASSSAVKQHLIKLVSEYFGVAGTSLQLKKNSSGIPFLEGEDSFFFNRFSLSGHGRFYAYSLSLINCETSVKQS